MSIYDESDNLSDHSPLVMNFLFNFDFNKTNTFNIHENINKIKFCWNEASCEDKENFRYALDWLLKDIDIPFDALNGKNFHCFSHSKSFNNFCHDIFEAMELATLSSIPFVDTDNNKNKSAVVGWNTNIIIYREKSILWHNIWKECGCPMDGYVSDIRRKTRKEYHNAIKFNKKK